MAIYKAEKRRAARNGSNPARYQDTKGDGAARMSDPFCFIVAGEPKGQPRPRAFAKKFGNKFVARVYDAGTAEGWKSAIAVAAKECGLAGRMLDGPIELEMICTFERPKSHFRTGKNAHLLRAGAPGFYHCGKPDLDNILKAAKDALKQIGAYRDDSQVCIEHGYKNWARDSGSSRTSFEIKARTDSSA